MGLTENQKKLIQTIAENKFEKVKQYALDCLLEDKTQKNEIFCNTYINKLQKSGDNFIELPYDLKNMLYIEDVAKTFNQNRYYISNREKDIYSAIVKTQKVNKKLIDMDIHYLNSTLLFGESGTGKTTFGRYIAYKMNLPFCYINFSGLIDSYMGNTSKNISKVFNYIKNYPCVLMLDEIDCISIERSSCSNTGTSEEMARITITLMQEFDKLINSIVVIGATNRIDRIDSALLRRFSIKHEIQALSYEEKIKMINMYLSDVNFKLSNETICNIAKQNKNQAEIINQLIIFIVNKIYNDITE